MGIMDTLSKHSDDRDGFFANIQKMNERIGKLVESNFHFEAAVLAIVLIEEFLRIEVDFFQELLQSSAFRVKDKDLNVVLGVDFSKLGLKSPSDLTFGQLIGRHYAFCKNDAIKAALEKINKMRTELLHKSLRGENTKYFDGEKEALIQLTEDARNAAVQLHIADDKVVQEFFDDLVRKTGADREPYKEEDGWNF